MNEYRHKFTGEHVEAFRLGFDKEPEWYAAKKREGYFLLSLQARFGD